MELFSSFAEIFHTFPAHEPTGEVNNFLEEPWYIWFLIIIGIIVLIAFIVTLGFSALR